MKKAILLCFLTLAGLVPEGARLMAQEAVRNAFFNPPESARSWVFWYWMEASSSYEGIQADLEAMAEAGLAGAYLMFIKGPADPPHMPPVNQLSPEWWDMVKYAFEEADRLGLKLTLHACDGFAVAGGPWVTPELSMQKVVWTETLVSGGGLIDKVLPQPETLEGYYKDIAVYAYPAPAGYGASTRHRKPVVTVSLKDVNASYLIDDHSEERLRMEVPGWIQYSFEEPFTARSIEIQPQGNNFQAKRLRLEVSDDGRTFFPVRQLQPPRHGWQDTDAPLTYALPATRARHFRLVFDPAGSEPGSEDLDPAKWKPVLSLKGIHLSPVPRLHQYEGKSGLVWRISDATTKREIPPYDCIDPSALVRITGKMEAGGRLRWDAPEGDWVVLRMGHTSTGHENYIGGAGKGLEIDKFNPAAARLQYDRWFGEFIRQIGPALSREVLHGFHVDSWECGSQNWSPVFREAFQGQHGYDPLDWLPAMAGVPLESASASESFLLDIRETISTLLNRSFFGTLRQLVEEDGYLFSAESVAPTMMSDGMLHHGQVDLPMGEFWLRSPSHDKPNDIADAISGGHVYGKNIIQAEAFTQVRMAWDEHPGNLKALGDLNLAKGINRFVFHVFTHNPWLDRVPGMTLDGVGLYFQRDQTWWEAGRAWLRYLERCQAILQQGAPVADIAVFTGDGLPRRSILPDRLVGVLPGLIGEDRVKAVQERLENTDLAMREIPRGVRLSANMEKPEDWTDPLCGYAYDSINPDALLNRASVDNGAIVLPGGPSYRLLVIPGKRRMAPEANSLSADTLRKLYQLVHDGATVLLEEKPLFREGLHDAPGTSGLGAIIGDLWGNSPVAMIGKGRVLRGPWTARDLQAIGIRPAFIAREPGGNRIKGLAWCERKIEGRPVYFVSNQQAEARTLNVSFRVKGYVPEILDPVSGEALTTPPWSLQDGRTEIELTLEPSQALFVAFTQPTDARTGGERRPAPQSVRVIDAEWTVLFEAQYGGPAKPVVFSELIDWSESPVMGIRFYSGTATYSTTLELSRKQLDAGRIELDLGKVANLAQVFVNGVPCGIAWTEPMRLEIGSALKPGVNSLEINVINTWANRLIGDQLRGGDSQVTRTRAPYRLGDGPLLPAGLLGPVKLMFY